ncbi:MAG: hypothetical protein ABGZ17_15210, partial [Planctomycetaceae bacterium]
TRTNGDSGFRVQSGGGVEPTCCAQRWIHRPPSTTQIVLRDRSLRRVLCYGLFVALVVVKARSWPALREFTRLAMVVLNTIVHRCSSPKQVRQAEFANTGHAADWLGFAVGSL